MGIVKWTRGVSELFAGERERIITWAAGRAYVEFRGVKRESLPAFMRTLTELTEGQPRIRAVSVNALTRRVVFRLADAHPPSAHLVALVQSAERAVLGDPRAALGPSDERALPDDLALDRELSIEAIADAAALLSSVLLRVVPFVPRRLGANLYGLLFMVSQVDSLRAPLDARLGRERADFFLRLALAAAQGLSQRPMSALVDLTERLISLRELRDRRALFSRVSHDLAQYDAESGLIAPSPERTAPVPKGPIERYGDRAFSVAMGSFGVSLLTSRSPSRAIAAGFSALPQPARLGRELFVSELCRVFARHGMLVLSREALRRMDRVDTLVVPAELVTREQFLLADVFALRGIARDMAMAEARALFSAERPLRVSAGPVYTLGPARLVAGGFDAAREALVQEREARGALVLSLGAGDSVVALVEVQIFPEVRVSEALRAARKLGLRLVVSTDDPLAAEAIHPDEVVGTGEPLREALLRLSQEGRTSMLIGRGASPAYAYADVAIALRKHGEPTPWGAHVLCPDDSRALTLCVEAVSVGRGVSEQSVRLAMGAAAFGTLASTSGRANLAARRVMFVVNAASLVAMLDAFRRTHHVEQVSRPGFDPTPWHALSAEGALHRLRAAPERLSLHVDEPSEPAALVALRELGAAVQKELENPLSPLLALGAGMSAVVGSVADAGIVAGVGGINAFVGGYQRYKTERAIHALTERARPRVRVQRAGRTLSIGADELVRGDVVELSAGDVVPADCRILESASLEVDAASLTGESMPVAKSSAPSFAENAGDLTCMVHEGTMVVAGNATAVVVALGDDTLSRRALSVMSEEPRGGVEARLRDLMRLTGPFAMSAGAALVAAGLLRGRKVDDLVATGVGLAVAAVPEGLPVLATAAQLATAQRLSRRGALVKNPRAIEALGRVDVLCMDKTGTLTEGNIELHLVHDGADELALSSSGHARVLMELGLKAVARGRGERVDPLDAAIVEASRQKLGTALPNDFVPVAERPFEATRGFEAVLGRTREGLLLAVKGAPEHLVERAHPAQKANGEALLATVARLAARGLRVLAVAERRLQGDEAAAQSAQERVEDPRDLTLVGLLAFRDPARAQSAQALLDLAQAHVRVVMITGDHPGTAHAVANDVGLERAGNVLTGMELATLTDPELDACVERIGVFARMSPAQKVRVVRALQRTGHVVGMVGDGANDAPAMRASDASIAVGPRATDSARAAADIVLAEAQIESIVEAVVEGRAMWSSVRDAVSILVGGNLGEIGFTVGVGAITGRSPLSPRQLLLVNFLTDVAPSMAIALRAPSPEDLANLRVATPEEALGSALDQAIVSRAISTSLGASGAWLFARLTGGAARARTVGLVGLVGSQLGQTLMSSRDDRTVLLTSLGSLAALGFIVQTPGLSQLFGCRPLGPIAWATGLSAAASATLLSPVVERAVQRTTQLALRVRDEVKAFSQGYPTEGRELVQGETE
jgi:magnesium-transporting ATPase (P-type)